MTHISRTFPRIAWAWPDGGRHLLIMAAICPDDAQAFGAITTWLEQTDLDDATFAEHRLLAAITTRFDTRLAQHPEYARLCGMQRLNWTRSRMAISTVKPVLEKMVNAGLQVILLKGACRVALDLSEQKNRTSYDLDLLLNASDFKAAFEILAADGWSSTRGESTFGLRARLSSVRARNFKKGRFGDIDLHRFAYHTASSNDQSDKHLLENLQQVAYYGLTTFIPCTEERLAMAIAHGGWDGQSHSDWLVDVARILETEQVDWDSFRRIIKNRRLRGTAAIALSYLDRAVGLRIPDDVLTNICGRGAYATPAQLAAMLLAKEADSMSRGQKFARACVANYQRARHSGRDKSRDAHVYRALSKSTRSQDTADYGLHQPIAMSVPAQTGRWAFAITITFPAPQKRRRIELELNSETRNLCHLQAFHVNTRGNVATARFRGEIVIAAGDTSLVLTALPGKLIADPIGSPDHAKYGAVPFTITQAVLRHKA